MRVTDVCSPWNQFSNQSLSRQKQKGTFGNNMHVQSPDVDNYVDERKVATVDRDKYSIRCSMFDVEKDRSTDRWERRTDSEWSGSDFEAYWPGKAYTENAESNDLNNRSQKKVTGAAEL